MSFNSKFCRICFTQQTTSKFNLVYRTDGKIAQQISEITGMQVFEFPEHPALICPKCTANLQKYINFKKEVIESQVYFNETLYLNESKDHFKNEELPINLQEEEFENEHSDLSEIAVVNTQKFSDHIKMGQNEFEESSEQYSVNVTFLDPQTGCFINVEPNEAQYQDKDFIFEDLPEEVLLALDDDYIEHPHDANDSENLEDSKEDVPTAKKRSRKEVFPTLICPICKYTACSDLDSQEHLITAHNVKKGKQNSDLLAVGKNWMCSYCGANFKVKLDWVKHRKAEHQKDEKYLICQFCYKQFSNISHLRIHIKFSHLGNTFTCPKCDKCFSDPEEFKDHMKIENDRREFDCEVCSASFILKHQFTHHMQSHQVYCKHCGLKFKTPMKLQDHIDSIHSNKRFKCGKCQKLFASKNILRAHIIRDPCEI